MRYADNLPLCFFNQTQAAINAGYAISSARQTAYRLQHSLGVLMFEKWRDEQVDWIDKMPKADIILPDEDDLEHELSKFDIKVNWYDLLFDKIASNKYDKIHLECLNKSNEADVFLKNSFKRELDRTKTPYTE